MFFTIFYNEKTLFYAIKATSSKSQKSCHFYKGVNSWFLSKNDHCFKMFFEGNTGKENVFHYILERKNALLGYKNNKLKKIEKLTFLQRG